MTKCTEGTVEARITGPAVRLATQRITNTSGVADVVTVTTLKQVSDKYMINLMLYHDTIYQKVT